MSDRLSGTVHQVTKEQVAVHLDVHDYVAVEELFDLPSGGWPIITRCKHCGVQSAERMGDIGWRRCVCSRNSKPRASLVGRTRGAKKLFVESQSAALDWWDHDRNDASVLATISEQSKTQCQWKCGTCGYSFTSSVVFMAVKPGCPQCSRKGSEEWDAERQRLKVTSVADVPELLVAWNDEADPHDVMVFSHQPPKFRCKNGHQPRLTPIAFHRSGCQFCRRTEESVPERATLAEASPEVASQWHPTLNGRWTPEKLGPGSKRMAHWLADCCGYEWAEPVGSRNKYKRQRCPQCRTILDSLGYVDPGLAAEWAPDNPVTPWHVRPYGQTNFVPRWICSVNPSHRWEASVIARSSGADCPECKQIGKSRVELQHLEAAKKLFAVVKSGALVRSDAFRTRKRWSVDILVEHEGTLVAIEYDGAYWHRPAAKIDVDRRKSLDLIAAGYRVLRLREDDLPSLGIESQDYLELQVYSAAPRPGDTITRIAHWLTPEPR
ncbi:zinc-ribbon domain-containing protein [Arthrobacter sp. ATA002]|uniref:zinc-ribbon domain-containing protein n=1 Tax=Arthrobacter sp. ATA002 TaxID=2991715 RepID=UPI0022A7CF46|nr:zinc-ribbon domain-containing protein [Arthrobacter sp. ATA002]WAP53038.1 zinc-ribbon domain-containing protein [Arthrobacter sp. ATA002]